MESPFVTFKMFADKIPAESLANFLAIHKVEYVLENNSALLDASFGGGELAKEFAVCIREKDVPRVQALLETAAEEEFNSLDNDYYLFQFTDDELREVVLKSDEWNAFDITLAKKLLKQHGAELTEGTLHEFRQQRIEALSQPEKSQSLTVLLGYLFAVISGFLGIAIGWFLWSQKKTLPNGKKVYSFNASDRWHGRIIMILGGGILFVFFIYEVFMEFFWDYQL